MAEDITGYRFWAVNFDARGRAAPQTGVEDLLRELQQEAITDLFIFSHGWNNDAADARNLYTQFFAQVRSLSDAPPAPPVRAATIGVVGIIWPSKRWDDEPPMSGAAGGAAGLRTDLSDGDVVRGLKTVFTTADQRRALDRLADLLDERPEDARALDAFQRTMRRLTGTPAADAPEDSGEAPLLTRDAASVFAHFAVLAPAPVRHGGAAGLGDSFATLWDGAKEALRAATYWEMKKRAGVVGQQGVASLVRQVAAAQPGIRIHLLGHSFGARVVAYTLAGLPDDVSAAASPIGSLVLLQGAFSHFAFARSLPFDAGRSGALAGMEGRVAGPVLVTHSRFDTAVGRAYPLASMVARDDAAGTDDLLFRWGAMGHDGAQAADAEAETLGPVGQQYRFRHGAITNLDSNGIIRGENPPPDAHSDIIHPEIAWAALVAAGIATGT
jgi:pimeloyl-ACP methyl ester carboxylesterase